MDNAIFLDSKYIKKYLISSLDLSFILHLCMLTVFSTKSVRTGTHKLTGIQTKLKTNTGSSDRQTYQQAKHDNTSFLHISLNTDIHSLKTFNHSCHIPKTTKIVCGILNLLNHCFQFLRPSNLFTEIQKLLINHSCNILRPFKIFGNILR